MQKNNNSKMIKKIKPNDEINSESIYMKDNYKKILFRVKSPYHD